MFESVNALYSSLLREHGSSAAAVGIPRDNQHLRYHSVSRRLPLDADFSLLDYGCGLGHLRGFLIQAGFGNCRYSGVDINPDFLAESRARHPSCEFLSREEYTLSNTMYDFSVAIGTFNLLYADEVDQQEFIASEIDLVFSRTTKAMFVNFMHTDVDYVQPGAWHQPVGALFSHVKSSVAKRVEIDSSYLPYEFTLVIYRD